MSHYTKMSIKAQQEFEVDLIAALKGHFGEKGVEVHENKEVLLNYYGEASGLKANLIVRQKDLEKAIGHHIASNDLGYERNKEGGYDVHYDAAGFPKEHADKINRVYAERVGSRVFVEQMGYNAAERNVLPNGDVEVIYESYS
jgi:hypothetical protein